MSSLVIIAIVVALLVGVVAGAFALFGKGDKKGLSNSRRGATGSLFSIWASITGGDMAAFSKSFDPQSPDGTARAEPSLSLEELSASSNPFPKPFEANWEDPVFLRVETSRAMAFEQAGNLNAAIACLESCSHSFPGRPEPLLRAALACARAGDFGHFGEYRQRLLSMSSIPLAAIRLIESIERIATEKRRSGPTA